MINFPQIPYLPKNQNKYKNLFSYFDTYYDSKRQQVKYGLLTTSAELVKTPIKKTFFIVFYLYAFVSAKRSDNE